MLFAFSIYSLYIFNFFIKEIAILFLELDAF